MIIEIPEDIEQQVILANKLIQESQEDKQQEHYVKMFQQHVWKLVCALILKKVYNGKV